MTASGSTPRAASREGSEPARPTRRAVVRSGIGIGASLVAPAIASGASGRGMKFANIMPAGHPLNTRMGEARDEIIKATDGRVDLQIFPASQLGTDNSMLNQLRSGAIEFFAQSGLIVASLVPVAAISGIGFAFSNYDQVWRAMDGALGQYLIKALAKAGLVAFDRMWDNGFRQTTSWSKPIRTPDDLRGFKIRVPPSRLWTSLFENLGASPTSIPWGETYSALQTHVADGLENPLAGVYFAKMYEVQKYLAMTNHMWDGFWFLANGRALDSLQPKDRDIVLKVVNEAAVRQRQDVQALNSQFSSSLREKGLEFVSVNSDLFRDKLGASQFYVEWKRRFGDEAWSILEQYSGSLG